MKEAPTEAGPPELGPLLWPTHLSSSAAVRQKIRAPAGQKRTGSKGRNVIAWGQMPAADLRLPRDEEITAYRCLMDYHPRSIGGYSFRSHRRHRRRVGAPAIFRAGVPELTGSADIKLNERHSLRRRKYLVRSSHPIFPGATVAKPSVEHFRPTVLFENRL
jgi:hypothetical protein